MEKTKCKKAKSNPNVVASRLVGESNLANSNHSKPKKNQQKLQKQRKIARIKTALNIFASNCIFYKLFKSWKI